MKYLLTLLSTPDGGVILDPFAGSGSTLLAAQSLARHCIGVELDAHNCDIAISRLTKPSK
jgi:site-specific DNA-methyltransferase (adenine-specific)